MTSNIKVVMLGTSLQQQGGMANLEYLISTHSLPNVTIQYLSIHEEGSLFRRLQVFASGLGQLIWELLHHKVDLVHLHVSEGGSVLRNGILTVIARCFGKPVIIHTHGSRFHIVHDRFPRFIQQWVAAFFRQSAYVITLSESWNDYYTQTCGLRPDQAITLYNPVKIPDHIPMRLDQTATQFAFLGRIGQRKGAFDLIRAIAQLPISQQQQIKVYLAGDGEVAQAASLIQSLELQDCVQLLGWIDPKTRSQLLSDSDAFILPSYNEGLPLSLLEAMSWGLPSITTPVGGIPEVANQQTSLFVEPGNVTQISTAIRLLMADQTLRSNLGRAARQHVMSLNVEDYMTRLHSVYCQAIADRPSEALSLSNS
jgi:glycosyltransferase involved in cell wall biosynthesis